MDHPHEELTAQKEHGCSCPFCDSSMEMPYPFCQACGSKIQYCEVCGEPLPAEAESCPHCAEEGL